MSAIEFIIHVSAMWILVEKSPASLIRIHITEDLEGRIITDLYVIYAIF